ncbi:hypothetical protein AMATHDRAFT_187356 [Amanita thiersii Skay4041]|uniref:non-specific serine/threonine protein kinase n=1 Tax=Amanita thiersii Skay4041 TaxID=703135 RepID=A0A2A9NY55_9AGAR|nr:hypothetical protein AMATHDRAFT_187356 [Amanita thiersii Skay4041]
MGNTHPGSTLTRTTGALDSFVAELGGDVIYERSLGSARFLKTVKCRHRNGYLVIKIYIKSDPGISLISYHKRLKDERKALAEIVNVYNYQSFVETDKAGYIIRQWIASNLYDRISTRPFLITIEKRWIAFQLITALHEARNHKVSHGDIKSENILVTSWNWVYLSDFASYKPTYLPLDDPSDFSFYFDTSGRRTCYIAPERFYTAADNPDISARKTRLSIAGNEGKRDGKVTEAMDCFSAGCVIAELFLEGAPLFTLSQLFKYREGEYNVDNHLNAIDDEGVRTMIKQMISLDPIARPTFDNLLHTSRGTVFPESFYSFLHNYVSSVNEITTSIVSNAPTTVPPSSSYSTVTSTTGTTSFRSGPIPSVVTGTGAETSSSSDTLLSDSDHRIERLWADYESVEPYLCDDAMQRTVMDVRLDFAPLPTTSKPFQDTLPVELHIPNRDSKLFGVSDGGRRAALQDGPALIILALVTANIRNCSLPSSKLRTLDIFLALSCHLTDEAKLDRMVPYIVELLHDEAATVRAAAIRTLVQVLMLVTVITPSNAAIFPEYIIPNIKHIVLDPEVSVRCTYAQCIVQIANTAVQYLEMGQALKAHGAFKLAQEAQDYESAHYEISYDASMQDLQNNIEEHLATLLMDPSSIVKRAVLHDISSICIFLGRQRTNDVLLSHMITYLNDRDWLLRHAFFESIVDVAACAGGRSLEEYILPLMVQALSDVEESVVAKVLAALTSLCELGLFQKMRIWELMSATLGFLYHPNVWIRQSTAAFIASAVSQLPPSDIWCILYPSLRHFLRSEVSTITQQALLNAMKQPLPRQILDTTVQWAMKADKASFWRALRRGNAKVESPRESVISIRKQSGSISRKSEEDESHLSKLQQLGMTPGEEQKLMALRDYIIKLADARASFTSRIKQEPEPEKNLKITSDIELQKLGVVPRTVFLKTRSLSDQSSRISRTQSSRRMSTGESLRTPVSSQLRLPRNPSTEHAAGAPFEDLRRRLATINGSATSLSAHHGVREARSPMSLSSGIRSPSPTLSSSNIVAPPTILEDERPSSPTESVLSTTNSLTFKPLSKMQLGGGFEGQKAAPAVGSSKMNVTGLLDPHSKLKLEGTNSTDVSGRSSPMSLPATVKGHRPQISVTPISTYDGQEPAISNLLESLYLDNSRDLQSDFGPRIHEGPIRRRNVVRHSLLTRDGSLRRMEATLVAHLTSHSEAVTGLAVSPDHAFFVSSSDDKTVKVWDTARLERNVTSKPRHTYGQHHARVKCVCILEGTHCFASAAEDGSLHVVRVNITQSGALPKYNKLHLIREHRLDQIGEYITCMSHYNTENSSNLVYATTHSVITVIDLRTMRVSQTMTNPRHYGPITCLCVDRKRTWLIVGTSTGVLSLWDLRFGLHLRSWHARVASGSKFGRIHQCVVHPSKGRGKWIMVAVETSRKSMDRTQASMIEVWDIENTMLVETFVMRTAAAAGATAEPIQEPQEVPGTDGEASPAAAIAALVRSREGSSDIERRGSKSGSHGYGGEFIPSPAPDIRALVVGSDFGGYSGIHRMELAEQGDLSAARAVGRGFMVSGSEDRKIRLWDLSKLERTSLLSGLDNENERPVYSSITSGNATVHVETWSASSGNPSNRPQQRISLITHNQQTLLKLHQDVVTTLACVDSPFRGGIVSGDRSGVIKVWRVDSVD